MKNLWIYVLLLVSLTACASAAADRGGCTADGEVCIKLQAEEPIRFGEPVTVTITVTSERDVAGLQVFLSSYPPTQIEDISGWVNNGVNWIVDIKSHEPQTFIRQVLLPAEEGIYYHIISSAYTPQLRAVDAIYILQRHDGSMVYYIGTSIPTQGPGPTMNQSELETQRAMPTSTPRRTITPVPTTTSTPTSAYPPPGQRYAPPSPHPPASLTHEGKKLMQFQPVQTLAGSV